MSKTWNKPGKAFWAIAMLAIGLVGTILWGFGWYAVAIADVRKSSDVDLSARFGDGWSTDMIGIAVSVTGPIDGEAEVGADGRDREKLVNVGMMAEDHFPNVALPEVPFEIDPGLVRLLTIPDAKFIIRSWPGTQPVTIVICDGTYTLLHWKEVGGSPMLESAVLKLDESKATVLFLTCKHRHTIPNPRRGSYGYSLADDKIEPLPDVEWIYKDDAERELYDRLRKSRENK